MSTRSVIAEPEGGGWRGRYSHSDGYPSHQLRALHALIQRDGVETVIDQLLHQWYGWSFIDPEAPDITGVTPDPNAAYGTAENRAAMFAKGGIYGDGRFILVPGYGTAYTTVDGQSKPDDWVTHDGGDWGTEWAYVLYPTYITVLRRVYEDGRGAVGWFGLDAAENGGWKVMGTLPHNEELTDERVSELECGPELEMCHHMAWVHFPEAKDTNYGTDQWLGRAEPRFHDVKRVIYGGHELELAGGGGLYYADHTRPVDFRSAKRPYYWFAGVKGRRGEIDIRLARRVKAGYKLEHPVVLPPTAVRDELVLEPGTVLR